MPRAPGLSRAADLDVLAVDQDTAGVTRHESAQHVHQRALASAVRAKQRMRLSGRNLEVRVMQCGDGAKGFCDALHSQQRSHCARRNVSLSRQMKPMMAMPLTTRFMKNDTPSWLRLLLINVTSSAPSTAPKGRPEPP